MNTETQVTSEKLSISYNYKREAVRLMLNNMFSYERFSIRQIDNSIQLLNISKDADVYSALHKIQSLKYEDMKPEFKEWIINSVLDIFKSESFTADEFDLDNLLY